MSSLSILDLGRPICCQMPSTMALLLFRNADRLHTGEAMAWPWQYGRCRTGDEVPSTLDCPGPDPFREALASGRRPEGAEERGSDRTVFWLCLDMPRKGASTAGRRGTESQTVLRHSRGQVHFGLSTLWHTVCSNSLAALCEATKPVRAS